MIDGVKLVCTNSPKAWIKNKKLSFHSWVDTETGEISKNNKHANFNGLHLSIKEGKNETYYNVRGSLPMYYTKGKTNAIDYNFRDFLNTIKLLNDSLCIVPEKAILRGFEFGVNVLLPFAFSKIYECVKSYKQHAFEHYTEKGQIVGIVFKFQQYNVKIYDKGLFDKGNRSMLMRFEISVKKMAWVKSLNIKTLSDLGNLQIWGELSKILLLVWEDVICIDKLLKYKEMSNAQQKKFLRYLDPHYWTGLNKKQYFTAKNNLEKLQAIYKGTVSLKEIILNLIGNKCKILITETAPEKQNDSTVLQPCKITLIPPETSQRLKIQKRERFNHLNKRLKQVNNMPFFLHEQPPKTIRQKYKPKQETNKAKKCKCMNCKKSLHRKRMTAKFCGLKCKNHYNGKQRTKANQQRRKLENKHMGELLKNLPKTDLFILIFYKSEGLIYSDNLKQSEIKAPPEWVKKITKVVITDKKKGLHLDFTTVRAKILIRKISLLNNANSLNKITNTI